MKRDMTPEEEDYSSRLYLHILNEVIGLDAVGDGSHGAVRPHIVRSVMMDVAATIDFNAQLGRVPSERRATGEMLGKRYATFLKSLIDNDTGAWSPAVRVDESAKPN